MLKGTEALALSLTQLGVSQIHSAPGLHLALGSVSPLPAESGQIAVARALGGALLNGNPTAAFIGPGALGPGLSALLGAGRLNEFCSPVVIIEGAGERGGMMQDAQDSFSAIRALAGIPIFDPGSARELQEFLELAYLTSFEGGMPVVLRAPLRALSSQNPCRTLARLDLGKLPPRSFSAEDTPYLLGHVAAPFHRAQRLKRLARMDEFALALSSRVGSGRRGVLLAGHLGDRAQALALEQGLATLRLGLCNPLPRTALGAFLGGLTDVLVLEEGGTSLFQETCALAHQEGILVKVHLPQGPQQDEETFTEATLGAIYTSFALGAERGSGQIPQTTAENVAGFSLARAKRALSVRPRQDASGEIPEEPYGLYLARLQKAANTDDGNVDLRTRLLLCLRRILQPAIMVGSGSPLFGPLPLLDSERSSAQPIRLLDVQADRGNVVPVASALGYASSVLSAGRLTGRPLSVAILWGHADVLEERLLRTGDLLYVISGPSSKELFTQGLEVLRVPLADAEKLERAVRYAADLSGSRILYCEE